MSFFAAPIIAVFVGLGIASAADVELQSGVSAYEAGNYTAALTLLRPLAEKGDAVAQNYLGLMYAMGTGVTQEYVEANRWFRLAAEQGYAKAQFNLGFSYHAGHGVPQDYAEAIRWYRLASKQGYEPAHANLWNMYGRGHGVPKDPAEADAWMRQALEEGDGVAQLILGINTARGMGVPKDYVQAYVLLALSAGQGVPNAAAQLQKLEKAMTPEQIAEAKRLLLERTSKEEGESR